MGIDVLLHRAAEAVCQADALLITAGAGMGVDSGLPDFRGNEGFWRANPVYEQLNLGFEEMARPEWFTQDPTRAWGFYGHRLNLYRRTQPHPGFALLRKWAADKPGGCFVFTSNVDGQFQKAGVAEERIAECHGSLHRLQCPFYCSYAVWSAEDEVVHVDETTMRAEPPLPSCLRCGFVARPNVLMFNDWHWLPNCYKEQDERLSSWQAEMQRIGARITVIELGAGRTIPTVRWFSERIFSSLPNAALIRINPLEAYGPPRAVCLASSALDALQQIDKRLTSPLPPPY